MLNLPRFRVVIFFGFLLMAANANATLSSLIEHNTCRVQIRKVVSAKLEKSFWISTRLSIPNQPEVDSLQHRDSKTKKVFEYWENGTSATFRETDLTNSRVKSYVWTFKSSCSPQIAETIAPSQTPIEKPGDFTDSDLSQVLAKNPSGLIYIWSPAMPLSLEGLDSIRKAASALKLNLLVIVDPLAPKTSIERSAKNFKIETGDRLRNASVELKARGFGLHYPAVAVYAGGFLSNRIYLGHKSPSVYEAWIKKELKNIAEESK